jgi:hypothetical protein
MLLLEREVEAPGSFELEAWGGRRSGYKGRVVLVRR